MKEFVFFIDNYDHKQFEEFVVKYKLYRPIERTYLDVNIDNKIYKFYINENNSLAPLYYIKKLENILNITKDEIITYVLNNGIRYNKEILIQNGVGIIPIDPYDYMWIFYIDEDKLLASMSIKMLKFDTLYLNSVNVYDQGKGYCGVICNELMKLCRNKKISCLIMDSIGGIASNRCYLNSFLINGYNYVSMKSRTNKFIMNQQVGKDWLKYICLDIECDTNYMMYFADDINIFDNIDDLVKIL